MNYRKLFLTLLFVELAQLAVWFNHDIYQVFIALVSLMSAYYIACFITGSRLGRLVLFALIAVAVCQISVTAKKAQIDQSFNQQIRENPTGAVIGDIVYGFKKITGFYKTDIKESIVEIRNSDDYTALERINYRYATMAIFGLPMCGTILFKRTKKSASPEKKRK